MAARMTRLRERQAKAKGNRMGLLRARIRGGLRRTGGSHLVDLLVEFVRNVDSDWAETAGRIPERQRELAISGAFFQALKKACGPNTLYFTKACEP